MRGKPFKRAVHVLSALTLIIGQFILPANVAFAKNDNNNNGTAQPVWCQAVGHGWTAQIGDGGSGNNPNRKPLTQIPAGASSDLTIGAGGQVYAPNSSDPTLKGLLDTYCVAQYEDKQIVAPVVTPGVVCGPKNDTYTVAPGNFTLTNDSGWQNNNKRTLLFTADAGYTFANGATATVTLTDTNTACEPTLIATPTVTPSVLCGPNNDTYAVTPGNFTLTSDSGWKTNHTRTLLFTANTGYAFATGATTTVTLTDTNTACEPTVTVIATPTVTPSVVCGPNNDAFVTSTGHYAVDTGSWNSGKRTFTFTAAAGYTFANGAVYTYVLADENTACPIAIPAAPSLNDPCGLNNASWNVPADTSTIHWYTSNGHLHAAVIGNYTFTDGKMDHDYGVAADSGVLCAAEKQDLPKMPQYTDPCDGVDKVNAPYWTSVPKDTEQYSWKLNFDGSYTVTAKQGNMFRLPNGMLVMSYTYKLPHNDRSKVCYTVIHTPKLPEIDYTCGATSSASWLLPGENDTEYIQNEDTDRGYGNNDHARNYYWKVIRGELWLFAKDGYVFNDHGNLVTKKNFGYASQHIKYKPCVIETPSYDSEVVCGPENDIVTPDEGDNYTVTVNSWKDGVKTMTFKTDKHFVFANEKKEFSITYTDEATVCPVPPAPVFDDMSCAVNDTVSYTIPESEHFYYTVQVDDGDEVGVEPGTYNLSRVNQTVTVRAYGMDTDELAGTWEHDFKIPVCTVGVGSVKPAVQELPHTGPTDNNIAMTVMGLVASVMTYAAVLALQRRNA